MKRKSLNENVEKMKKSFYKIEEISLIGDQIDLFMNKEKVVSNISHSIDSYQSSSFQFDLPNLCNWFDRNKIHSIESTHFKEDINGLEEK